MEPTRNRLHVIPLVFLATVGALSVARHLLLGSSSYDLGIKSQLLFNCAAGRWCESSFEVQNYFGDHFNPTFLLLVPVYALVSSPLTLIVLQGFSVALGGWIVGALTVRWLPDRPLAAALAQAVYLFHPSTVNLALYDVHEHAFGATLMLLAVLVMERRRLLPALVCAILLAGCKEDGGLGVAALGTWLIVRHKHRTLGCILIAAGFTYSFIMLAAVMPQFRGGATDTMERYTHLGATPTAMLLNVVRRPHLVLGSLFESHKLIYILFLLLPTLFVPLLRPKWLLPALWVVLPNLISSRPHQCSSQYQYDALITPFIVLAMIRAWCALNADGRLAIASRRMVRWTAIALLVGSTNWRLWYPDVMAAANIGRLDAFRQLRAMVPPEAPLSASMNLGPHVIRRQLLDYPNLDWPADRFPDLPARQARYVLVDYCFELYHRAALRAAQHESLLARGYTLLAEDDEFVLYEVDRAAGNEGGAALSPG